MGFTATVCSHLFCTDVAQAYLKISEKFMQELFISPPQERILNQNQLILLLRLRYVVSGSGDYWGKTLQAHIEMGLERSSCVSEGFPFSKM